MTGDGIQLILGIAWLVLVAWACWIDATRV